MSNSSHFFIGRVACALVLAFALAGCANGNSSSGTAASLDAAAGTLTLSVPETTLAVNGTETVVASGGVAPYVYSILTGGGSIISTTGYYTAPATSASVEIEAVDADGNVGYAYITVGSGGSTGTGTGTLVISPSSLSLASGSTYTFAASNGTAPYYWTILSGGGSIGYSTGLFTAPTGEITTVEIEVVDSAGNTGVAEISVTVDGTSVTNAVIAQTVFSQLTGYNSGCTASNPFGVACNAAIDDFCQAQSFSGGFGPTESSGSSVSFVCLPAAESVALSPSFATLKSYDSSCGSDGNANDAGCRSAVDRYCRAQNYVSGFGPVQESNGVEGSATVICVNASEGSAAISGTFAALQAYGSACTLSNADSEACNSAVDRYCAAKSYKSGFGLTEYSGSVADFVCVQ